MEIKNKKALFNYEVIEKLIAGIVLTGTEIKSIREGKASLIDTYCFIKDNEVWLKNSYIKKFDIAAMTNHEERRDRKLLLSKQEIRNLQLCIMINDRNKCNKFHLLFRQMIDVFLYIFCQPFLIIRIL